MIRAMHKLIALQDKAMALTARLAVALMLARAAPAAAIHPRVAVMPGSCRKQKPEKIHTSFSRRWTGPGSRRVATALEIEAVVEVLAVVEEVAETVEVAGIAALAARQAQGSRNPAAMFRGSKHPDAGMTGMTGITGVIETIAVDAATARSAARAPISQIR